MNNILDNLFYKEKFGIGNKATFIKNVRERHPDNWQILGLRINKNT